MAKKKKAEETEPDVGDVITDDTGWTFHIGEQSVSGTKVYEPGVNRDVDGKTLDDARECAAELDRVVYARQAGISEQNQVIADRLHAEADKVAAG